MLHVSLIIEILRSRPRLVFWTAVLLQATAWVLIPALFYAAPPADLAELLINGRGFKLGAGLDPPLAYWLAQLAFLITGHRLIGVYVLAQICVVATYWAVFSLGRGTVGERHAVLATLLMVGISAFTLPTADFGPAILAMPFWALAVLHFWYAASKNMRGYWYALALDLGLLLLTTYLGLILAVLLILFMIVSERARARFSTLDPWIAGIIVVAMMFPNLMWLDQASESFALDLSRLSKSEAVNQNLMAWLRLIGLIIAGHAGLGIMVALASNLNWTRRAQAAVIDRDPIDPFARSFIFFFALMPALVVTLSSVIVGYSDALSAGPLVVLSGLAIVVAAGDHIMLHHQRIIGMAWFALLLVPPAFTAAAVVILPWIFGIDLKVSQPAADMGRFFSESFERRTGKPLALVAGDRRLASLIALSSPSQPHVLIEDKPRRNETAKVTDASDSGAIVVWPATDSAGTPPPQIKAQFPNLVPELPRAFERSVQGRLSLLRVGWAVIRPQHQGGTGPGAAAPSRPPPRIIMPR